MSKVLIGCKLPNGITLDGINGPVTLNGSNTSMVIGGDFGITTVDEEEAAYLFAMYELHSAFQSKSIFTHNTKSVDDLADLADELKDEKTGLEGINPDAPAKGLAPADATKTALQEAQANRRPAAPVANKADKSAALELANKQ
jgi:hypothetical protein